MVAIHCTGDELWERIERAVDVVNDRLRRTVTALDAAGIRGNVFRLWVAQVDESVVGNTRAGGIAINRSDLPAAIQALESSEFLHRHHNVSRRAPSKGP